MLIEERIAALSRERLRSLAEACGDHLAKPPLSGVASLIADALDICEIDWDHAADVGRGLAVYPLEVDETSERGQAREQGERFAGMLADVLGRPFDAERSIWKATFETLRAGVATKLSSSRDPALPSELSPQLLLLLDTGIAYGRGLLAATEDENSRLRRELEAARQSSTRLSADIDSLRQRITELTEALDAARRNGGRRAGRSRAILSGVLGLLASGIGSWIGVELADPPAIEVTVIAPDDELSATQFALICAEAARMLDPSLDGVVRAVPDLPQLPPTK